MKVRFHPAARAELLGARAWYEERSPFSAAAFLHEVAVGVGRIADEPERNPRADHGTRRLILPRFPFSIFYRLGAAHVTIVAIAHQKRRPGYWRTR